VAIEQPLDLATQTALFTTIRAGMLGPDAGLALVKDPVRNIVVLAADAAFYDLQCYVRSGGLTFSGGALAACAPGNANGIRAVTSGQIYEVLPSVNQGVDIFWFGDVITGGQLHPDTRERRPDHRHIGKWAGRTEKAYAVAKGDPRDVRPRYREAIGALLPIIEQGRPFTATAAANPSVGVTESFSPTLAGEWLGRAAWVGKIIFGIHRAADLLFVMAQEDGYYARSSGVSLGTMIGWLHQWGVTDAAMGDGSDTVMVAVDGVLAATATMAGKDPTTPNGLALRQRTLVASGSTTVTTASPALAAVLGPLPATLASAAGTLSWTPSGVRLEVASLGGGLTASQLGLPALPVTLSTASSNLVGGATLSEPSGPLSITATLVVSGPTDPGTLTGPFTLGAGGATATGSIAWGLAP
jgi:hypothetical protein